MTHHYPILTPYVEEIKSHKGREWFMLSELPDELRDVSKIKRAHSAGLVANKRGEAYNGRRLWKVVL